MWLTNSERGRTRFGNNLKATERTMCVADDQNEAAAKSTMAKDEIFIFAR